MSHALLAIQNILQNSNILIGSRETVLFTSFGKKKVAQFSGLPPTSVSYLNVKWKCDGRNCLGVEHYKLVLHREL